MKPPAKPPLSSPGRAAEKFPPPLMRFLRTTAGSRSRRSGASPMLYLRRRKSLPWLSVPAQEPFSPKVTCMGQVRVRRPGKSGRRKPVRRRVSWSLKRSVFCCGASSKSRKVSFSSVFRRWGLCSRAGYCKKVDEAENSFRVYSDRRISSISAHPAGRSRSRNSGGSDSELDFYNKRGNPAQERRRHSVGSSSSPPKNALLLTRCRSAPYRSSSLASRLWAVENEAENAQKPSETQNPGTPETAAEHRAGSKETVVKDAGELKVHPLLLTRCKSEPARTGDRLNPEPSPFLRRSLESGDHRQSN